MPTPNQNLFTEFSPISKAQWLAKIEKDLKGSPLSDLDWTEIPPLSIKPFLHADDFDEQPTPIICSQAANTWAIGEDIEVTHFGTANKQTLAALMAGVNAPRFVFDKYLTQSQLSMLLKNIELDYISTHFQAKNDNLSPLPFLMNIKNIAGEKASKIKGAVHFDPFAVGENDMTSLLELMDWASENFPHFAVITVNVERFYQNTEGVVLELSNALIAGENYLKQLTDNGLSIGKIQNSIAFRFQIGSSYFVEIAKLRAFKLLWGNVLAAYNGVPTLPRLFATTSPLKANDDVNIHKIQATTQAMSAVMAGIETLTVAPSEPSNFGRRIARNVQHLLSLESYLDRVADPAAGSYYIEKLTEQLAEAAWAEFQKQTH